MEYYNTGVLADDSIEISGTVINLHTVPQARLEQMYARYQRQAESADDLEAMDYYAAATDTIKRVIEYRIKNPETNDKPVDLLEVSRAAKVGESVACPQCKSKFEKTHAAQAFCSNAKTSPGGNCKDRYWNLHSKTKKDRLNERHDSFDV